MNIAPIPSDSPNPEASRIILQTFADLHDSNLRLEYQMPDSRMTVMVGRLSLAGRADQQLALAVHHRAGNVFTGMLSTLELGGEHDPLLSVADADIGAYDIRRIALPMDEKRAEGLRDMMQAADFSSKQPLQSLHARLEAQQYPKPWHVTFLTDKRSFFDA